MVNVRIECECGQHYAFDIKPTDWHASSTVACPSCGVDGTTTASSIIANNQPPAMAASIPAASTTAASGSGARLRVSGGEHQPPQAPAGVKVDARTLGLVDRETAKTEARAKISWGDSPDDVVKFLMLQGFSVPEATEVVQELFQERLAALRVKGTKKIILGIGMMCVPVIAWFAHLAMISLKLMAAAMGVGMWGFWLVLTGILMVVTPKMESGDVAE